MNLFAFLNPFFTALSDGKLIRLTVAWVLRFLAVLMALIGLFWFIAFVRFGFKAVDGGMEGRAVGVLIGFLLFALFGLVWGYLAAGIFVFRARSITELGDSHFTVLSILSLLFRLNGELAFVSYTLLGVGGCLFVWFTNFSPFSELGMLSDRIPFSESTSSGFMGGIELAILFLLIAFVCIVFFYALAELSVVLVEIALNTRGLRPVPVQADRVPGTGVVPPQAYQLAAQPFTPTPRLCKNCGKPLDAGSIFCADCGTPVA